MQPLQFYGSAQYEHIDDVAARDCVKQIERLVSKVALQRYADKKAKVLHPTPQVLFPVPSFRKNGVEYHSLVPANLLKHVDLKLLENFNTLPQSVKELFVFLHQKTVTYFKQPQKEPIAKAICQCERAVFKEEVTLEDSRLVQFEALRTACSYRGAKL